MRSHPAWIKRGIGGVTKYEPRVMALIFNNPNLKNKRRELRQNQTETEKLLWKYLRGKQLANSKFFRQYSAGPYIIDFYCPTKRLAIELDGGQHAEVHQQAHDERRSSYLRQKGITVLRFWDNEVFHNTTDVLEKITETLLKNDAS